MSEPMDDFLATLIPPAYDRSEVADRRAVLEAALEARPIKAGLFYESGSFAHGTGIVSKSDVDYLAWATPSSGRPSRPSSALTSLKAALANADWRITGLSISSPVVQVRFMRPPHFEIVPAFDSEDVGGNRVWKIPGRGDEWVKSSPSAHKAYVNAANDRLDKRVKPLIRFAKAWKYHVGAPVSSFYLEMRIAEYANTQTTIFYDLDLRIALSKMISNGLADMNDPSKIVGRIPPCSSQANRQTVLRLMQQADDNLRTAYEAKKAQNASAYWTAMTRVFGFDFSWPRW